MRPFLLLVALAIPSSALAGKWRARPLQKPPPESVVVADDAPPPEGGSAPAVDAPALDPGEDSLWDYIEELEGAVPDEEAVEASEELEEAREAEEVFVESVAVGTRPPLTFYTDPVGTLDADPLHLADVDPAEFDIPVVINDDVIRWMEYFTGKGRKYYEKWLARSTRYRPMMYEKLEKAGLPRDLVYLSMIESGYATHAYSRAAAVGLWQFIAPTAVEHGLALDWWVDERRDPERATDAAILFLSELHGEFGHWYLAWAAYNGGPGRVERSIKRYGTDDFWRLVELNAFHTETDNYVPKLLAAAIIGKHPERYGFTGIEFQDPIAYDTVEVGPSIGLDVLARCAGTSQEELAELNPHLRRWALPPEPEKQWIRVPKGRSETFLAALDKVLPTERLTYRRHKVSKGETLSSIGRKYGVGVDAIQSVNRIKNPNRIYVGMELVIPSAGAAPPPERTLASTSASASRAPAAPSTRTHVVSRGENLSTIAARYGVRLADLMEWNGISDANHILVGQRLKIYGSSTRTSTGTATWTTYTVQRGDTLSTIASRNGCTVSQLREWNGISGSTILVGQKLKIKK